MDWGIQGVDSELEGRAIIDLDTIDGLERNQSWRGCPSDLRWPTLTQMIF